MNPLSIPFRNSAGRMPPAATIDVAASSGHRPPPPLQALASAQGGWSPFPLLQVLDALSIGLLVLGGDGRLQLANRAARAWCVADRPVSIVGDELRVPSDQRARLTAGLQAARGGQWTMVSIAVGGDAPWHLGLVPLVDDDDVGPCRVLAVLGAPAGVSDLGLQFFGQQHQFTPTEMQVLQALAAGLSPAQIARDGQVALCTVRTQIAAMREKARAPTLRHLLLMLGSLPPIGMLFGGR